MTGLKKILVPVDGSEPGARALEHAVMLAQATGAELDILTVVDLRQVDVYDGFYLTDDQLSTIETVARKEILQRAADTVGNVKHSTRLLKGSATALILEEAEKADLVVVGRTGKNALERFVEGSTSRGLALHCKVPVTIVA